MTEPDPVPHSRPEEILSRARAEALALAGEDRGRRHRTPDEGGLVAAALEAHRALSRDLGRSVPLTALGPDGGVRGLTAFLAVYAARRAPCGGRPSASGRTGERGDDVAEFTGVHGERLGGDRGRVEHREHRPHALDAGVAGHLQGERGGIAARVAQAGT